MGMRIGLPLKQSWVKKGLKVAQTSKFTSTVNCCFSMGKKKKNWEKDFALYSCFIFLSGFMGIISKLPDPRSWTCCHCFWTPDNRTVGAWPHPLLSDRDAPKFGHIRQHRLFFHCSWHQPSLCSQTEGFFYFIFIVFCGFLKATQLFHIITLRSLHIVRIKMLSPSLSNTAVCSLVNFLWLHFAGGLDWRMSHRTWLVKEWKDNPLVK